MGEVYVAFDTTLQRKVALKAVRQDRLDDEARARLLREARILSQLDHPGICRVFDYVTGDGSDYLVLELIDGKSLRDAMAPLDYAAKLRIAEQIAQALVVAHAAGIVHRDLKPDNVMLLPDGSAKVLDFGLARAFDSPLAAAPPGSARTASTAAAQFDSSVETMPGTGSHVAETAVQTVHGILLGTPAYMAPEQAAGEPATAPSDMYAFGLLLQELFTAIPPYDLTIDLPTLLDQVRRGAAREAVGLPRDLAALVAELKAVAPSRRPTAVDAVARLRSIRDMPARRLRYALAAGLVLLAVAGAIKYTVDLRRERNAAVLARLDADQRRNQAEDLIGFMVGDLRRKLTTVGRLDLLDAVGTRAMRYFATVPPGSLSDKELLTRSAAIYQIGEVSRSQGDLKTASLRYKESLDLVEALARRDPANAEWQLGLAASHFYLGNALLLQGDLDGATRHFGAYRDIGDALAARDPSKPEWLIESSYGHSNVAAALEAKGDFDGAIRELQSSLEINRRLVTLQPQHDEWQDALAVVHNRLAVVLEKTGDARRALQHHLDGFAIRKAVQARQPDDAVALRKLADAASWIGLIYRDDGDEARAGEFHELRLAVSAKLAAKDEANVEWQRELGIAESRMATLLRLRGDLGRAAAHAERAVGRLRPIAANDPTHTRRQRDAADGRVELASIRLHSGRRAAALEEATAAAAALEAVLAKTPKDLEARRLLADAYLVAAAASAGRGRPYVERARLTLEETAATIKERRLQKTWALVLRGLGRSPEAEALTARLRASGFRPFVP